MEIWKEIPGTEYSVSSEGRAASRKFGKWRVMRPTLNGNGYPCVSFYDDGTERVLTVHQLVAEAFLGPRPSPKHQVNHIDGVRNNPRVDNLEWVTQSGNQRHRFDVLKHGNARGESCNLTKLTEADVREIRIRLVAGELQRIIAADYGIYQTNVSHIATRKTWAWLD